MEQRQAVRFCLSSQKATELVSRKPQSTEAEAEDWLLIGNYIGILFFFDLLIIDYWWMDCLDLDGFQSENLNEIRQKVWPISSVKRQLHVSGFLR